MSQASASLPIAKIDFTFTSISLSGSWIDFKRFSRDEIPSGNPIWLKVLAAASLTGISLSKR